MEVRQNDLLAKAFPKPRRSAPALQSCKVSVCGDFCWPRPQTIAICARSQEALWRMCFRYKHSFGQEVVQNEWLEVRGLPGMRLGRDSLIRVAGIRRESWLVLRSPSLALAIRSSIGLRPANPSSVPCKLVIDKPGGYLFVSGVDLGPGGLPTLVDQGPRYPLSPGATNPVSNLSLAAEDQ